MQDGGSQGLEFDIREPYNDPILIAYVNPCESMTNNKSILLFFA